MSESPIPGESPKPFDGILPKNRYLRKVFEAGSADPAKFVVADLYEVFEAFSIGSHPVEHAVKKLLCGGMRGHKDTVKDYREAIQSIERAIQIEERTRAVDDANDAAGFVAFVAADIHKV